MSTFECSIGTKSRMPFEANLRSKHSTLTSYYKRVQVPQTPLVVGTHGGKLYLSFSFLDELSPQKYIAFTNEASEHL